MQILALREEIGGLEVQRESAKEQLALIREEHAVTRGLLEQGLAQKPKVLALERAAADLGGSQGRLTADIAKARQNILAAETRITSVKKDWLEKLIAQLREVQSRIADLSGRIGAAGDVAARTEVRAPVTGIVIKLHVHTFGGVMRPGEPLLELLPTGADLLIEARVNPDDIDIVFPGAVARLRFPALRLRTTPTLEGRVEFVSADRMIDPGSRQAYYVARVRLGGEEAARLKIHPGMPVEVFVDAGARTALEYLAGPIADVIAHSWREQ